MDYDIILTNPFIMLPATWCILAGISFMFGWCTARKGYKKLAIFFAVLFASFTSAAGFAIMLGWVLRNPEVMEKWTSTISLLF